MQVIAIPATSRVNRLYFLFMKHKCSSHLIFVFDGKVVFHKVPAPSNNSPPRCPLQDSLQGTYDMPLLPEEDEKRRNKRLGNSAVLTFYFPTSYIGHGYGGFQRTEPSPHSSLTANISDSEERLWAKEYELGGAVIRTVPPCLTCNPRFPHAYPIC